MRHDGRGRGIPTPVGVRKVSTMGNKHWDASKTKVHTHDNGHHKCSGSDIVVPPNGHESIRHRSRPRTGTKFGKMTLPGGEKELIVNPEWRVGRWRGHAE